LTVGAALPHKSRPSTEEPLSNASGMRVTDAVTFFRQRGELRGSVQIVRTRTPDRLRWRSAVSFVTAAAAPLLGRERLRVEEPVRELVLDLPDAPLRREVVLDARKVGLDLDRGEVLPRHTLGDLGRLAFMTGTDVAQMRRYVKLPDDFFAPIDTAGAAVIARALGEHHRVRAHRLLLQLPDLDAKQPRQRHEVFMAERAESETQTSERWAALAKALVAGSV
jgi:hypothetical protein